MGEEIKNSDEAGKKIPAAFVAVSIIVIISFVATFLILREKPDSKSVKSKECPALAKICSGGKPAKMNPETCEFEPCPETDTLEQKDAVVGNDRDEHGCIGSAGYTWCEEKQKCLRNWEESCESLTEQSAKDLKTYKNDKYRFSVKYPSDWPVKEPGLNECNESSICSIVFGEIPSGTTPALDTTKNVYVSIHSKKVLDMNQQGDGFSDCSSVQKMTFSSGINAEKKMCTGIDESKIDVYSIKRDGILYQFTHTVSAYGYTSNSKLDGIFEDMARSINFD